MSLLDENLVDQELVEVQFKSMIDEVWERLNDGTLDVKSLKKKPLSEYEINGVGWRFVKKGRQKDDGRCLMRDISYIITSMFMDPDEYKESPGYVIFADKECAKEFTNKMIDLYWGKDIYTRYELEWRPGNYWLETQVDYNTLQMLDRGRWSIKELLLNRERYITDKQLLDWIHKNLI